MFSHQHPAPIRRLAALSALLVPAALPAADFYVNASTGLDTNPGTQAQPWKTLTRVNQQDFNAGDRLFFAGGQTFAGTLGLTSEDSGTATNPVIVGSYGAGRATISAGNGAGVSIYNASGIRVRDLILVGAGKTVNTSDGLSAYHDVANTLLAHLRVDNVEAHGFGDYGISVGAYNGTAAWQDVVISDCVARDNLKGGIFAGWAAQQKVSRDITIRRSVAYNNTGDPASTRNTGSGILIADTDGGLIEHCIAYRNGKDNKPGEGPVGIWTYNSNAITIQFCESYENQTSGGDGGGFDLDQNTTNSIVQYCYSRSNAGAGYLIYDGNGDGTKNSGNVIRYNVSQNDGRYNNYPASGIFVDGNIDGLKVYGNTIYMSPPTGTAVPAVKIGSGSNLAFHNNIFQVTGGARLVDRFGSGSTRFEGNAYWSGTSTFAIRWTQSGTTTTHSSLSAWRTATGQEQLTGGAATGLQVDPKLTAPGTGATIGDTTQLSTLNAYRLQADSPLINAGRDLVAAYGITPGTRDFYGNSLPEGGAFDIGAHEYPFSVTITAHASDAEARRSGTGDGAGTIGAQTATELFIGNGNNGTSTAHSPVYAFQLPNLGNVANPFTTATFSVALSTSASTWAGHNVDVYGLGARTLPDVLPGDAFSGGLDSTDATRLVDNWIGLNTGTAPATGVRSVSNAALVAYLNAQYASGAGAGKYVFLRLSPDAWGNTWKSFKFAASEYTANTAWRPKLVVE